MSPTQTLYPAQSLGSVNDTRSLSGLGASFGTQTYRLKLCFLSSPPNLYTQYAIML